METIKNLQNKEKKPLSRRRAFYLSGVVLLVSLFSYAVSLGKANISVSADSIVTSKVAFGDLVQAVSGTGVLVPYEERVISASVPARVEKIVTLAGTVVTPDTVIMTLSNPELQKKYDETMLQVELAEAEFRAFQQRQHSNKLEQQARLEGVRSDYNAAELQHESEQKLVADKIVSELQYKKTQLQVKQLKEKLRLEKERFASLAPLFRAENDAKKAQLALIRRELQLQQELIDNLNVKAGISGIVQVVDVETGESVEQGKLLAVVARQDLLKGELRIIENQARNVSIGQTVSVQFGNSAVLGKIARIDPAVRDGTVTVDVTFDEDLPAGARPQLRINGTVVISRIEESLHMGIPFQKYSGNTLDLYVVDEEEKAATKRTVLLGRSSITKVEVIKGLKEGEVVVLSDMSNLGGVDRFTLKP